MKIATGPFVLGDNSDSRLQIADIGSSETADLLYCLRSVINARYYIPKSQLRPLQAFSLRRRCRGTRRMRWLIYFYTITPLPPQAFPLPLKGKADWDATTNYQLQIVNSALRIISFPCNKVLLYILHRHQVPLGRLLLPLPPFPCFH